VEIEQFDDEEEPAPRAQPIATPSPHAAEKRKASVLDADTHAVAQSKLVFGTQVATPEEPLTDKDKKRLKKKRSFHMGALRPISRLF
jgi:hypothetical protein